MDAERDPVDAEFDQYADEYDVALERGLSVTGEGRLWYARERLAWVRRRLNAEGVAAGRILDFGCGDGSTTPEFFAQLDAAELVGVDVSPRSVARATALHGSNRARFASPPDAARNAGPFDLAYCNGVFHHIPLADRLGAVRLVHDALRVGGHFAFWENNPWNPGTRWIMSRVSFDRDAITLSPPEARRLLRAGGFHVVCTEFRFFVPRSLAPLRALEPSIARVPLGGQYLVWCRKISGGPAAESASKSSPAPSARPAR